MTGKSPARWRCDVCDDWVFAWEGEVLWDLDDRERPEGFQIVHRFICDDRTKPGSCDLSAFLGPEGLDRALSLMCEGSISIKVSRSALCLVCIKDTSAFGAFLRRLQVPESEQARSDGPNFGATG
jgi:hypothetical protein